MTTTGNCVEVSMNKLKELTQKINEAKDAYYNSASPVMSDEEYDRLVKKAEMLGYIESVGTAPASELPKIKHEHQMLSLDKVHTISEIRNFMGNKKVLAMYKEDGLSISATYLDGVLTRLETRGNGSVGNDIMIHAKSFMNLPLTIEKGDKYVIDGECVILRKDFDVINRDGEYKNPRNLAAGSLNLLDPKISATRCLRFYAWDVIEGGSSNSLDQNLAEAHQLGFDITPYTTSVSSQSFDYILNMLRENAAEDGMPIDGVVIKFDDIEYGRSLGSTIHHPLNAIAYKYEDEEVPSIIRSCEWQVGKTGQITPVLNFDQVEIEGTIVEKASAHNISILKSLGATIGCTCYVIKANSIIPQVIACDNDGYEVIEIPKICPVCGSPTTIKKDNESEVLTCTNPNCGGQLLGKLKHFVSRKGMDISGLSEETLRKFISLGWLNSFVDIYSLGGHYNQIVNLDGFGKKSADKLMKALDESRQKVNLVNFITALSIPGIGEGQAKSLIKVYPTWYDFMEAKDDPGSYQSVDGIGEVLDRNIRKWFMEGNNLGDANVLAGIMHFEDAMNKPEGNFPLVGMTFVVTGKVNHFANRDELKAKIEELGGKVVGSVSAKTSYLINNDATSATGKNMKAQQLGISIISEEDFLRMIE